MIILNVNDVFRSLENEHYYRVLWVFSGMDSAYIFDMNTLYMPVLVKIPEWQNKIDTTAPPHSFEHKIIAEDKLNPKDKSCRDNVWERMKRLVLCEPEIFDRMLRGQLVHEKMSEVGLTKRSIYKYLRQYWLRGKTINAFLPNYQNCGGSGKERNSGDSKRGRPRKYGESSGRNVDEETKRIFEKAVKKYYHSKNGYSLKVAYELMIKEHYTKFVTQPYGTAKAELLSENEIPTIGQFRYWYGKKHDVREKVIGRKG